MTTSLLALNVLNIFRTARAWWREGVSSAKADGRNFAMIKIALLLGLLVPLMVLSTIAEAKERLPPAYGGPQRAGAKGGSE